MESLLATSDESRPLSVPVARGLAAGLYVLAFHLSMRGAFDPDEIEATHTAWKIAAGERIYVDFFQHHHPLVYAVLEPLLVPFSGAEAMLAARLATFGVFTLILLVSGLLARELYDRKTAAWAVTLLLATPFFVHKAIEIRPDVPMTLFALTGIWALLRGLDRSSDRWVAASGLCFGIAFAFLQKALVLAIPVIAILLLRGRSREGATRRAALFGTAFAGPCLGLLAWMAIEGAVSEYVFWSFLFLPQRYAHGGWDPVTFVTNLRFLGATSAVPAFLFLAGVSRGRHGVRRDVLWILAVPAALFVALGRHHAQYYLPLVPLAIPFAARGLTEAFGRRERLIALALVVSALPAVAVHLPGVYRGENRRQLERIAYAEEIVGPGDRVLDPRPAFNVTGRDLDFFWFNVGDGGAMTAYRERHGYAYDTLDLVRRRRPRLILRAALEDPDHPSIRRWYDPAPEFEELLVRRPVPRPVDR